MRKHATSGRSRAAHLVVVALSAATLTLPACGSDDDPTAAAVSGTYVAEVPGSDAFIGFEVADGNLIGYLCDGKGISAWFTDESPDGSIEARSESGVELAADLAEDGISGDATLANGRSLEFEAEPASGDAGVYRSEGESYVGGWVLLEDGRQRGSIGGIGKAEGLTPAPPLTPKGLDVGKISFTPVTIPRLGGKVEPFTPVTIPRLGPGEAPAAPIPPSEGGPGCRPLCELNVSRARPIAVDGGGGVG